MSRGKLFKLVHLSSTVWFMLCMVYVLVLGLREAGTSWWLIFSLSGHSALLFFLLVSLYLFAIFRGVDRSNKIEIEHPLSSSVYYDLFYDLTPFLGGMVGCSVISNVGRVSEVAQWVSLGTLVMTFGVWIIVDPLVASVEKMLPASRKHRKERLAEIRTARQEKQMAREKLLADLLVQEQQENLRWEKTLEPYAEKLATLLSSGCEDSEIEAADIGARAWQLGGLGGMRQLYNMTIQKCEEQCRGKNFDYLSVWWDGIGSWRNPSLM